MKYIETEKNDIVDSRKLKFKEVVEKKHILFITTKNIDYIRNAQELRILNGISSDVDVIYSDKKNYFLRIMDVWRKITKEKVNAADAIFIGFEPQFVIPYVGYKFKNKPVYIDFFISVYDTLIFDRQKFKDKSLPARYFHHIDEKTLKRADIVVTDTKAHADFFIEEFNCDKNKFEVIYLEADPTIYYPRKQKKAEELKDKFIVLYFGSVLPLQGIEIILNTIREMKDEDGIYFDIIGPIPDNYDKPKQCNVKYTDWLSQEELSERIAQADLCLAGHFNKNIAKASRTIAGKTYIYEMMRKRMILGDGEANRELYAEDDRHFFVEMSSEKKLRERIIAEYQSWKMKN